MDEEAASIMGRIKNPFECKYYWLSRDFGDWLDKKAEELKNMHNLNIAGSGVSHLLYLELSKGNIKFDIEPIKFHNMDILPIENNKYIKLKKVKNEQIL